MRPPDFDAFWQNAKQKLAAVPMNPVVEKDEQRSTDYGDVFQVTLDNIDGTHLYGWLCRPHRAGTHAYPAILDLPSAGVYAIDPLTYCTNLLDKGAIAFKISVHNLAPNAPDADYQALAAKDYPFIGDQNRDTYYFKRVFLGLVRALEFLKSESQWDGKNLIATGRSQGGGLAFAAAGLDGDVTAVAVQVPAFSNMRSALEQQAGGWPYGRRLALAKPEVIETVSYYDSAHFAARMQAGASLLMGVGLLDEICPPSSSLATFNAAAAISKKLMVAPDQGHEGVPTWLEDSRKFMIQTLR
ncbi:MAG: acetylxylan esterase [Myxococcota bacterium]